MTIELDHTIIPSRDKDAAARFFARIFGLKYEGPHSHFAPVKVNDRLTLDFDNASEFGHHHYAFHVSDAEFDDIFGRIEADGIVYGGGPRSDKNVELNHRSRTYLPSQCCRSRTCQAIPSKSNSRTV